MQEAPLTPAHPAAFGFWARPVCFPTADGLIFYGGCTPFVPCPRPSPLGGPFVQSPRPSPLGSPFVPSSRPSPLGSPFVPSPMPSPLGSPIVSSPMPSPRATPFTPSPTWSRGSPFTPSPRAYPCGSPWWSSSSSGSRVDDAAAPEHGLRLARLALQYQDATNRYELCPSHLADAALRLEKSEVSIPNSDLAGRFAMLGSNQASAVALADQFRGLHLGQVQAVPAPPVLPMPMARPASPAEKHAVMPKSISIRSTFYLKMARGGKHRVTRPMDVGSQRVFVGVDVDGAQAEEHQGASGSRDRRGQVVKSASGLEFEVYCQGMYKTELCNHWEESGACPYGDQCQFAHGIAELRPIIRHPRYKTQVCRIGIGGALCPYGYRCHFRHPITPADHLPLLHP